MMNAADIFLLLLTLLLLAGLIIIRAVMLAPAKLTPFELQRRIKKGDDEARRHHDRHILLPRLITLRRIVEVVCIVLIVILSIRLFGAVYGALISIAGMLLSDIAATHLQIRGQVQRKYAGFEPQLLEKVSTWRWLDMLSTTRVASKDVTVASKEELNDIISRSHTVLSSDEKLHLQSALAFNDGAIKEIMTPRSMIVSVDQDELIGPLVLDQLHKTGHNRFPVTQGDIDHVVGILYLRDLITLQTTHDTAKDAMQTPVFYIREDQDLEHALHAFLRTHHHLFIVVNKFRETVGLLTLEDVIEALLGRHVIDEFDEYEDIRKVAETNPRRSNEPKGKVDL